MLKSMDIEKVWSAARAGVAVTWFILLFFLTITVAIVALSASQLQGRLSGFSNADSPLSVWQVERFRHEWKVQEETVDRLTKALANDSALLTNAESSLADMRRDVMRLEYLANRSQEILVAKLMSYDPLKLQDLGEQSSRERHRRIMEVVEGLRTGNLTPDNQQAIATLRESYEADSAERDQAYVKLSQADQQAQEMRKRIADGEVRITDAQSRMNSIIDPTGTLTEAKIASISDLMSEFAFIEGFAAGTLYKFSVLPNEFLIMVLVIAMGTLGSTLHLTFEYYSRNDIPRTSHFLLRPMLGAITAIVMFILLRAGVIVITDSAKLGEAAPLSPFFIAFVGIVSGFLSENALETIRRVGNSWFSNSAASEKPRWGKSLNSYLTTTKTLADLAGRSATEQRLLKKYFDEEIPVPLPMQKIIAVWLDKDMRDLFTDFAPAPPVGVAPAT